MDRSLPLSLLRSNIMDELTRRNRDGRFLFMVLPCWYCAVLILLLLALASRKRERVPAVPVASPNIRLSRFRCDVTLVRLIRVRTPSTTHTHFPRNENDLVLWF